MTHDKMEDSVSGFRLTGPWEDVVEHGERVSAALTRVLSRKDDAEGVDVSAELREVEEFEEWRPKIDDRKETISERTAEQASVSEGTIEKEEKSVKETASEAQDEIKEAVDSAAQLDTKKTQEKLNDSVVHTGQVTDSLARRTLRWLEEKVYKHIMTRISPYYFDNQLVNANFTEHSKQKYTLEINVADDELRDCVREEMEVIEEEAPRWRLETEVNSEPAKEAEGVEDVPDQISSKSAVESSVNPDDNNRVLRAPNR